MAYRHCGDIKSEVKRVDPQSFPPTNLFLDFSTYVIQLILSILSSEMLSIPDAHRPRPEKTTAQASFILVFALIPPRGGNICLITTPGWLFSPVFGAKIA